MTIRAPLAAALLAGLFLLLAALALGGVTRDVDARLLAALRMPGEPGVADVPRWLVATMLRLTWLGAGIVRAPVAIVGALILLRGGARRGAIVLLAAWAGESLLVQLIKAAAGRARPELMWRLADASDTSFPSGHAAGTMLLYPLLGLLIGRLWRVDHGRIGAAVGVAVALLVGATRMLLGVHWASDVVAGWLLGGALAVVAAHLTNENKRGI